MLNNFLFGVFNRVEFAERYDNQLITKLKISVCFHCTVGLAVICIRNRFAKIFTKFSPSLKYFDRSLKLEMNTQKNLYVNECMSNFLIEPDQNMSTGKRNFFFFLSFDTTKNNWSIFCLLN